MTVARQYRDFAVTIPANTPIATPVIIDTGFGPFEVPLVEVRIPPGPNGRMGFQIAVSGTQIIPWNRGQWIVGDNESLSFPTEEFPNSGAWQVIAYNTGVYDHTIYVRYSLNPVIGSPAPPAAVPDPGVLSTVATQSEADTAAAQASLDDLLAQVGAGGGP